MGVSIRQFFSLCLVCLPVVTHAAWTPIVVEPGKRIEIDVEGSSLSGTEAVGTGRIILDKPIVDPKTGGYYRIIEVENRFNCVERTYATLKRSYFKDEGDLLRQEAVKMPSDIHVRAGTPDDKFLREICRPQARSSTGGTAGATTESTVDGKDINKTIARVNEIAVDLKKFNDQLILNATRKEKGPVYANAGLTPVRSSGVTSTPKMVTVKRKGVKKTESEKKTEPLKEIPWSYEGIGAPANWGKLNKDFALCSSGLFQSPIDLQDGIAVDLDPLEFDYTPSSFKVMDGEHSLRVGMNGGELKLSGKKFTLSEIVFHRPSETKVNGHVYAMEAQLIHKSEQGMTAIVSVLLESGIENPAIQMILNYIPLKKGGEEEVTQQKIDLSKLLPENKQYFTYMGSLTTPPCTEDVLWLVLKTPHQVSPEQLAIFQRLHHSNARPTQPLHDRLIKQSR